jgi:hypothetical protein
MVVSSLAEFARSIEIGAPNGPKVEDAARFESGGVRYHISADR